MGNANQKSYGQITTAGDNDGEEDLTFIFHSNDADADCAERVVHDNSDFEGDNGKQTFTVRLHGELIAERDDLSAPRDVDEVLNIVNAGDAVEFVARKSATSHWAVYVGNSHCIHLRDGAVLKAPVDALGRDCKAKIANEMYKFKSLPVVQILHNAESQLGKTSMWKDSECFAMWCRTGKTEFTFDESLVRDLDLSPSKRAAEGYVLRMEGQTEHAKAFSTLTELISHRRRMERSNSVCFDESLQEI